MIKGMTGFGSSVVGDDNFKAVVEVRSVNHRYFDGSYYLPAGFNSVEIKIRQLLQKMISRGRVTVSIKITRKPSSKVVLNKDLVKKHLNNAKKIKKEFGLENDLTLSDIIRLPGVIETQDVFIDAQKKWSLFEKSLKKAVDGLVQMRKREGRSLSVDVGDKLKKMKAQTKKIQQRCAQILKGQKTKLTKEEFLSFQKSSDVGEEISRLNHYVEELSKLLKSKVSVGKRIDFIAQEMNRETNTIGSKIQDGIVSNSVIALKSKVEKIREQAQNIE